MNWWEKLTEWLSQFFDKKVVVIIVGVTYLLVVGLILFSKTSLGKKAINKLTELHAQTNKTAQETKEKVRQVEILANEKINELKTFYEQKTTALVSIVDYYEQSLFDIIEEVPNAKVQAKLEDLKGQYLDKKKEIAQWVVLTYQDQQTQVNELVKTIQEEKDQQIARLKDEINELKELIKPLLNESEEGQNGEREESENTQATQENI